MPMTHKGSCPNTHTHTHEDVSLLWRVLTLLPYAFVYQEIRHCVEPPKLQTTGSVLTSGHPQSVKDAMHSFVSYPIEILK